MSGLPDDVAARIAGYAPDCLDRDVWATVRERVLALVVGLLPTSRDDASRLMRVLAYYLGDLWEAGVDVDGPVADVFHPRRVERFMTMYRDGRPGVSFYDLRRVRVAARALNPSGGWPVGWGSPAGGRAERTPPYTPDEVDGVFSAISGLRRGKSRDLLTVVTNVVLGCGAASTELVTLEWSAFVTVPGVGLVAMLPGGQSRGAPVPPRPVPVASPYADVVAGLAGERAGPIIRESTASQVSAALESASAYLRGAENVTMTRLRTTWMVERARAGVTLPDLAAVAGISVVAVATALDGRVPGDVPADAARKLTKAVR